MALADVPAWCRTFFLAASAGEATTTNPSAETIKATDKIFMLPSRSLERVTERVNTGRPKDVTPRTAENCDHKSVSKSRPGKLGVSAQFQLFCTLLAPSAPFGASSPLKPKNGRGWS